jgi:hypothetical protein
MSCISKKEMLSLAAILTACLLTVVAGQGPYQLTPQNLKANASGSGKDSNNFPATFTCVGPLTEDVTWSVYDPSYKKIYRWRDGYTEESYSRKYQVSIYSNGGVSTFTVLNPGLDSAIVVSCFFPSTSIFVANLIVIEKPISSVLLASTMQPPTPSEPLTAGTAVILQCLVRYASPTNDGGFQGVSNPEPPTPEVMMLLGGQQVQGTKYTLRTGIPGHSNATHSITVQKNYTITAQDFGKQLTCTVAAQNPSYSDSSSARIRPYSKEKETILNWSRADVQFWLYEHHLQNQLTWFEEIDGGLLIEYLAMRREAPETFYSVLHENKFPLSDVLRLSSALNQIYI